MALPRCVGEDAAGWLSPAVTAEDRTGPVSSRGLCNSSSSVTGCGHPFALFFCVASFLKSRLVKCQGVPVNASTSDTEETDL